MNKALIKPGVHLQICFVGLVLSACSGGKNRTDVEIFHDMIQQKNIKPQEGGTKTPWEKQNSGTKTSEGGKTFMRKPPLNSRARGTHYYPYKAQLKEAEKHLKNPLKGNFSAYVVGLGKRQYEKACIYCHGASGLGEGKVALKMAVPPPSFMDKAFKYSDARLYHIIHQGQGLMGSYQWQVKGENNRWALVNYIRILQRNQLQRAKKKPLPVKKQKTTNRKAND